MTDTTSASATAEPETPAVSTAPETASLPEALPLPAGAVDVFAGDLQDVLTALLACTSTTSDYPAFTSIRLEAGNGRLAGMATDQYVLGHATKPAAGTAGPALLSAAGARRMLAELAVLDRYEKVRLTLEDDNLALTSTAGFVGCPPVVVPAGLGGYPARLAEILTTDGYDQIGLTGLTAFAPRQLARITEATKTSGDYVVRLYFRSAEAPLRVEAGTWLVLLIMPYRTTGDTVSGQDMPQTPAITAGLPGTPLQVELNPVEPTAIGWPATIEHATPARLARHYAAHTQHLQHRMFNEPFPKLPRYAEQNPTERRIAAAMSDLSATLVTSYAASLLIRAFHQAAPAAADAACRDLWEALNAGDCIGEETWGWLKADQIDPEAIDDAEVAAERHARAVQVAWQAFSTPPPADPFRKPRADEGDDQEVTAAEPAVDLTNVRTDVRDFGAKGDGVTDDTAAFQAAIDDRAAPDPATGGEHA